MILFKTFLALSAICMCLMAMGMPSETKQDVSGQLGIMVLAAFLLFFIAWNPS